MKASANMATKKKTSTIPAAKLDLYQQLVSTLPGIALKGATMPYTSHQGHMFSFLDSAGTLGLRLAEADREEFISKFKTSLCRAHGTVLKEYVEVPDKLFKDVKTMKGYFARSFRYVDSLKPKATKK